jgi:hypothetical protein
MLPISFAAPCMPDRCKPLKGRKGCTVEANVAHQTNDALAIRSVFKKCGHRGSIKFELTTHYMNSVLGTTGLKDVDIDIQGLYW